jgi:hypothetical protein
MLSVYVQLLDGAGIGSQGAAEPQGPKVHPWQSFSSISEAFTHFSLEL